MTRAAAPLSLKARALRHLARREHSRAELERKLAAPTRGAAGGRTRHGGDEDADAPAAQDADQLREQIQCALDELAARGLQSDTRAAESVLASQGRRFGSRRLKQTLQAKGLDAELVAATLQRSRATEFERALDLWRRRFGAVAVDAGDRARQARFLAGRGFDGDIIRRLVKGVEEN